MGKGNLERLTDLSMVRQERVSPGFVPRSSGSMFTVLPTTSCLTLWPLVESERERGMLEGSAPCSLQPVTRGSLLDQLWPPRFLQCLERRKIMRILLIAKGSGIWGSEPHRSKEYYIYLLHHFLLTQGETGF